MRVQFFLRSRVTQIRVDLTFVKNRDNVILKKMKVDKKKAWFIFIYFCHILPYKSSSLQHSLNLWARNQNCIYLFIYLSIHKSGVGTHRSLVRKEKERKRNERKKENKCPFVPLCALCSRSPPSISELSMRKSPKHTPSQNFSLHLCHTQFPRYHNHTHI